MTRHPRVEVPGIGVFSVSYVPASYEGETSSWIPMSRSLNFEPAQVYFSEAQLLVNSYMRKYGVSSDAAHDMIKRGTEEIIAGIENDGEVALGNIGILTRIDSKFSLTPRFSTLEYSHALGRAAACDARGIQVVAIQESADESATIEDRASRVKIGDREFDFERNWYLPINKMFVRSVACLAVIAVMVLSVILPSDDRTARMVDQANVLPVESLIRHAVDVEVEAEKPQPSKTAAPSVVSEESKEKADSEAKYYLVVATMETKGKAEEYVKSRGEDGEGLEIVSTATRSRVSAASASERETLVKKMQEAEFQKKFPQAWIWEK